MIEDCTAVILAGGDSRRMGQDKAGLVLDGKPLLQHVSDVVVQVFPSVMISVREPRTGIDLPQVCDAKNETGPLAGLAAALAIMETPWLFAVACDMPFIEPTLLEFLASQRGGHQAVVPVVQGYPQPLAAYYSSTCLDAIREVQAGSGKRSLRALLELLDVRYVDEAEMLVHDARSHSFFDLDTPEDVAVVSNGAE